MTKSSPDVYQSPYSGQVDDIGFQTALGMATGQGIKPSPAMNSSIVAQQLGGKYDNKTGLISMPDGTSMKYDTLSGQFQGVGGQDYGKYGSYYASAPKAGGYDKGFKSADEFQKYTASGGTVYDTAGNPVNFSGSGGYLDKANQSVADLNENVYNNPNSSFNLFSSYGSKDYNPSTGTYEDGSASGGAPEAQRGGDYYLQNYGQHLNQDFSGPSYSEYQAYQPKSYSSFDYKSPTIGGIENVSNAARENEYQNAAENVTTSYRDKNQANEDWTAHQGGSLSSGRAARMQNDAQMDKTRDLTKIRRGVDQEHEMRNYNDAAHVRDMQASQDMDVQKLRGMESQYGQNFNQGEGRYGYEAGAKSHDTAYQNQTDAARYGYESGQTRGNQRMAAAESMDANQHDRAFQELQADRQQKAVQMSALLDMLRVYGGQDSTAVQLAAAQSQAVGSALGGLTSGIGSAVGGWGG